MALPRSLVQVERDQDTVGDTEAVQGRHGAHSVRVY
jgi:hypothetical protein